MTTQPPSGPHRRAVLMSLLAGASVGSSQAFAAPERLHVAYPGTHSRAEADRYRAELVSALGPEVGKALTIRIIEGHSVVMYDRSSVSDPVSQSVAARVARHHDAVLHEVFPDEGPRALVVPESALDVRWNIRYGAAGAVAGRRKDYATVSRLLGPELTRALVVEQLAEDLTQLVYRRGGAEAKTAEVAAHHTRLLRASSLVATAVPDGALPIAWDGTSAPIVSHRVPTAPVLPNVPKVLTATWSPGLGSGKCELERVVEQHVKALRRRGEVSSLERTAWLVYDLESDLTLCSINASWPLQAASMVKPFAAVAFLHEVSKGRMIYGPTSRQKVESMIRDSNNDSTNWVMKQLGGPAATERILRANYGDIVKDLSIDEYIPSGGRTYRNRASAADHARLLKALWTDHLPRSAELKRIMNLPGSDRLYHGVPEIPPGTEVYNKTGTTAQLCGDMGILVAPRLDGSRLPYVLVGIIERSRRTTRYTAWSRGRSDVIRSVSSVVYRWLADAEDLVILG